MGKIVREKKKRVNVTMLTVVCSAVLLCSAAIILAAESLDDYMIKIKQLGNHGQYEKALVECEKAMELFPDSIQPYDQVFETILYQIPASYRIVKKKLNKFMPPMETMEFIPPAELQPEFDKLRGKINKIKAKMSEMAKNDPRSALAHYVLAQCLLAEVNLDYNFQMAEKNYKGEWSTPLVKDQEKINQALAELERSAAVDPAKAVYAYAAMGSGKIQKVKEISMMRQINQAYQSKKGNNPYAAVELDDDQKKLLSEGKELLQQAVSLDDKLAEVHFWLSEVYSLENDIENQRLHLEKAVASDPYNSMYRYWLGNYYSNLTNRYLLNPVYEGAVRPNKIAAVKKEMMEKDSVTQEDINKWLWNAIYAYETTAKLTSNECKYFKTSDVEKMIDMLLRTSVMEETISGDYERVIAVISKELRANPDSPGLYSSLGYYYVALWNKDSNNDHLNKAIEYYNKSVELAPEQFRTHMDLVTLYFIKYQLGEKDALTKAKEEYRWVQENDDSKEGYWKEALDADLILAGFKVKLLQQ